MIMNRLLLIIWCIELTSEKLLTLGFPTEFSSSSSPSKDLNFKWPTIRTEAARSTQIPDTSTASKSQHEAKKVYKNEYGYSISEVYDSQTQKNDQSQHTTAAVPDTPPLLHSLSNPLRKSNILNEESRAGHVPKLFNPFESKLSFSPASIDRSLEKRRSPNLNSIFFDSNFSSSNFSSKFSDKMTPAHTLHKLNSSFGALIDNSTYFSSMPSFDKLELFDDVTPSFISTSTVAQPVTQKSFFGYNIKEVTSNGKTRGTVQVFGNDGVEKNVRYNELSEPSNITKFLPSAATTTTTTTTTKKTPVTAKTQSTAQKLTTTTTTTERVLASTTVKTPAISGTTIAQQLSGSKTTTERPRHIIIEDVQPFTHGELVYEQPIASEFATPEFILYDFLGQLQTFPYIPAENFDENRHITFDELVSQNTYVYSKR